MSRQNVVEFDKAKSRKRSNASNETDSTPTTSQVLIAMAQELYRFVANENGVYGIATGGGNIAIPIKGDGPRSVGSVRQGLIRAYYQRHQKPPNTTAVSEALDTIMAIHGVGTPDTETHVRVAPGAGDRESWLDLGRVDGQCVRLRPGEWSVETPGEGDPVFRRTRLIGELPLPQLDAAGDWQPGIDALLSLVNVDDTSWPLMLGWIVAAILPDAPCPVLYATGEQGTGKSTAAQMLGWLFDHNPVPRRKPPENDEDLSIMANAGWCLALDNISVISERLSDALCRIVTGDGVVTRTLYTNTDVSVLSFRRPVMLTSIDAGALRGDLAERLLKLGLRKIDGQRKTEKQLWADYRANHALMLGGVLHLAAAVLAEIPAARAELEGQLPRMADFAVVLGALDRVAGTESLKAYLDGLDDLNGDVVDASPVLAALAEYIRKVGAWEGKPDQLRAVLTKEAHPFGEPPKSWPRTSGVFSAQVRRGAPALRSIGIQIEGLDGKRRVPEHGFHTPVNWWSLAAK